MSVFIITSIALHIDTTALSDGTYELIPDSEGGDLKAQVNTAVLTEAPDQSSLSFGSATRLTAYHIYGMWLVLSKT